ncbi:hypothetical protein BDD12DRAFT_899839 [Trichophaea hybrida]|nr:hypothetical protein BDD12DRAFT_899839 [Trichophaea hybrida]
MTSSLQFASAYMLDYIGLESEVMMDASQPTSKRYMATVPVPDVVPLPGIPEYNKLESTVSIDNLEASVTAFFPSGTEFYSPCHIVHVCAKFVALTTRPLVLDISMHQSLNGDVDNPPDVMPCPIHICGRVESVYRDLPENGPYRGYNVQTGCWMREFTRSDDFIVRVVVPPNKRFDKTPLPHLNSLVNLHGYLFGHDKVSGILIIMLKEFSFLPKSSSTSEENSIGDSTPASTPRKKDWSRAPPTTPKSTAGNPSADLPCSTAPPPASEKRKHTPLSPTPIRTVTISDGNASSTSSLTIPAASPDDSGDTDMLHEEPAPGIDDIPVAKNLRKSTCGKVSSS